MWNLSRLSRALALRGGDHARARGSWIPLSLLQGYQDSPKNLYVPELQASCKGRELLDTVFHDLRHMCATILLMVGKYPKYVQELLGHANISITLDNYSHVIEGMDGGLGDAMDQAL